MTERPTTSRGGITPALLLTALFALPACGGGGGGGGNAPTPVTQPPGPVTTTLASGTFTVGSRRITSADFNIPAQGNVTASISWTSASNDVDLYITSGGGTCPGVSSIGAPTGPNCSTLCSDIRVGQNSATCTVQATSGAATIHISNLGSGNESGTYSITLTR